MFVFSLQACAKKNSDTVAEVNSEKISRIDFDNNYNFYKKYYDMKYGIDYLEGEYNPLKSNKEKLREDILDSLIHEKIIADYLKKKSIKVTKDDIDKLKQESLNASYDKDSLKANIAAFDENLDDYDRILEKSAVIERYKRYFRDNFKVSDKKIVEYFKKNRNLQRQYKYSAIEFESKKACDMALKKIKNEVDFTSFYDNNISNYKSFKSDFVYADDPLLSRSKMIEKNKISDVFEKNDKYYIIMINSVNDNVNDLLVKAKEHYINEKMKSDYKRIIKKAKVKIFL